MRKIFILLTLVILSINLSFANTAITQEEALEIAIHKVLDDANGHFTDDYFDILIETSSVSDLDQSNNAFLVNVEVDDCVIRTVVVKVDRTSGIPTVVEWIE